MRPIPAAFEHRHFATARRIEVMMANELTAAERKTLNDAMAIIGRHTPIGSSWLIDSARYRHSPELHFSAVTYFDSNEGSGRAQHSRVRGETFADKVQTVIEIEATAAERAEANRAERVEALRAELAKLEQAA
jgi:hypothetical protein